VDGSGNLDYACLCTNLEDIRAAISEDVLAACGAIVALQLLITVQETCPSCI